MTYTLPFAHPHATKDERRRVLTGTDLKRLMEGDWLSVWQEKTGRKQPDDLRFVFRVQLGLASEKLHARWHQHQTGDLVVECPDQPSYFPAVKIPGQYAATFDYWIAGDDVPLELKHTNERNTLWDAAQYYMAQLQWQLYVCGRDRMRFSIIRGNNEPEWGEIARDQEYINRLVGVAETFWSTVTNDIPPEDLPPDEEGRAIATRIPINGMKKYDHSQNNEWTILEAQYVQQKAAADAFKSTDKEIRKLIPADALEVQGQLTRFKRDARGAYRCTIIGGDDE